MTSTPPQPAPSTGSTAVAWDDNLLQNPHAVADKQKRVQRMFAAIAPSYDLNNRVHSLWVDQYWRRKAVKLSNLTPTDRVVDVACGTGDLTLKYANGLYSVAARTGSDGPREGQIVGIDYTFEMLPIARLKAGAASAPVRSHPAPTFLGSTTRFLNGDAQRLPLPDASADVVSIAFGIRNVADPAKAIREFYRVLRPGGRLIILEFSLPTNPVLRGLYNFYFRQILPRTATLISGDKSGAYKYLPESVNTFIGRDQMRGMMNDAGFTDISQHAMTFGVCICYRGVKKA
ncbi:ubiquinone/menaquinone biosynthesis methyltransferase [Humisphaera borealis]|uniref:Demethylmenaquinone methyltransferase n=1 Tax=Humisphaera borealis TaxID=2807512 RepID=A0A7M2WQV9_9BACT|nr:ubiquinone/menaquinone biosynthesis methyltransferase [Humisphaera borealis]QOV87888.1 ubiquinone/menaquinone biosynthesis methyltransferase [Humisphaera borealis]